MTTTASFYIQPFNDLQEQFYGVVANLPKSSTFFTGSINTAEFDNFRDGMFLRTVNDYFRSDQVKLTTLPTSFGFIDNPNGVVDHDFPEFAILGISSLHSYTVNGNSIAFRDQVQGVDQQDYSGGIHFPGMVRYFQQSSLVASEAIDATVVYPFFVDSQNRAEFNGHVIEPFPLYTGMVKFVQNPLSAQTGIRGSGFLGLDSSENANPLGSSVVGFGDCRNLGSLSEYQHVAPRPFLDVGADMIIVEAGGMFVGKTSQRDNDVLTPISCSRLTPWQDEYSGKSFIDILGGERRESLLQLLGANLPIANNDSITLPYYAADGYEFGDSLNIQQTRDTRGFGGMGWHQDTSYNQSSLYSVDSVAYAGYTR